MKKEKCPLCKKKEKYPRRGSQTCGSVECKGKLVRIKYLEKIIEGFDKPRKKGVKEILATEYLGLVDNTLSDDNKSRYEVEREYVVLNNYVTITINDDLFLLMD